MEAETDVQKRNLNNLRGKYIKQALTRLEDQQLMTSATRKVVLDAINDLMREVYESLGYKEEV